MTRLFQKLTLTFALFAAFHATAQDTYRLFYLGGQSNMEGFGYNKDLPADLQSEMKDVYIFDGNRGGDGEKGMGEGKWENLRPGHGTGFRSDGKSNQPSDRFGVELAFAKRIKQWYPNDKIAIIKYARNGSSIDSLAKGDFGCWEPEYRERPNQYDFFLNTMRNALAVTDVNGDGKPDKLLPSGILWMQGEGDASFTQEIASEYEANLKHLMQRIRAALHDDAVPVVIGRISDSRSNPQRQMWKYGNRVRQAQADYVRKDDRAALVTSTDGYRYSDPYHYDSTGYLDLGKEFADAWYKIITR